MHAFESALYPPLIRDGLFVAKGVSVMVDGEESTGTAG